MQKSRPNGLEPNISERLQDQSPQSLHPGLRLSLVFTGLDLDCDTGVSENRGSKYSTLNSRILMIRTPNKVPPILGNFHMGVDLGP